jgi:hypothetical protein
MSRLAAGFRIRLGLSQHMYLYVLDKSIFIDVLHAATLSSIAKHQHKSLSLSRACARARALSPAHTNTQTPHTDTQTPTHPTPPPTHATLLPNTKTLSRIKEKTTFLAARRKLCGGRRLLLKMCQKIVYVRVLCRPQRLERLFADLWFMHEFSLGLVSMHESSLGLFLKLNLN